LFDLDGTLIDTIELILRSYRHTMRAHRGAVPPDEQWMQGLGTPLAVQFRRWSDDPAEIAAMVATYRAYNHEHHEALARPYPGVSDAVLRLRGNGTRLAVVTSKLRDGTRRGLRLAQLEAAFDAIVCADDVTHPKPHAEPVLTALQLLGVPAADAVFIGDARPDLLCGRAAGVRTAAALWGPFDRAHLADLEPDYWLERPADIVRLFAAD
jgi:pyrophosphatase PpaX